MSTFAYRKKPVEIEAFQVPKEDAGMETTATPQWFFQAILDRKINVKADSSELEIVTLEGTMTASIGDYIIRGIKGELYPCKEDIFLATYDKI